MPHRATLALRWSSEGQKWITVGAAPHPDLIRVVVGYALTSKMRLPAIAKTVEEARYQARKAGRSNIIATDIRTAILEYQIPSYEALQNAFQSAGPSVRPAVAKLQSNIRVHRQRRLSSVFIRNETTAFSRGWQSLIREHPKNIDDHMASDL